MTKNDDVQLGKFARRVMKLESTEALCKYFERFLATLGFTGFMYTAIPGLPKKEPSAALFLDSVLLYCTDMKIVESLMKSEIFGRGPVMIKLMTAAAEPFSPYQAFKDVTGKPPPGRPEEILEDPSIAYSLICAMDAPDRRHGITLLSAQRSILGLYRQFYRVKNIAYSGAVLFHERWKTLADKKNRIKLSTREAECLMWAAQGKTAWEMGNIMNISERTVRFHITNATEKLNAVNTTQSVALAIANGIIPAEPFE